MCYFFADLTNFCVEYINANVVIAFCLYLMNKMRGLFLGGLTIWTVFLVSLKSMKVLLI